MLTIGGAGVAAVLNLDKEHQNYATRGHFPARIFFIVLVLKKFGTFGLIKTNYLLRFHRKIKLVSKQLVGGILSNESIRSPNTCFLVVVWIFALHTYDWAILNLNWPC